MPDNETLLARRSAARIHAGVPLVGDYVILREGREERISHDWGDAVQTSAGGSFYLGDGFASFSGALNPAIPKADLVLYGEKPGRFWFFDRDYPRAGNGVDVMAPCRVWLYVDPS